VRRRPLVPAPAHPALLAHAETRAGDIQNRLADRVTGFSGSMRFIYLHIGLFALWMLVVEHSPWQTLTLIVSLEAIFLSTFVLLSQNRADAKRQLLADHQWELIQIEQQQNEELLRLSKQILNLTQAVHALTCTPDSAPPPRAR
jgi:uncharacterized membrane protein